MRVADRVAIMRAGRIVQLDRLSRIVMAPADDYVAEFIQDIPIGRVVTVGKIAAPLSDAADRDAPIDAATKIERVVCRLGESGRPCTVAGVDGALVGEVLLQCAL